MAWSLRYPSVAKGEKRGKGYRSPGGSASQLIAPFAEQQRIVAILGEQLAAAEQARKAIEEELAAIIALPAALLRRAFSGAL